MRKKTVQILVVFLVLVTVATTAAAESQITSRCGLFLKLDKAGQLAGHMAEYAAFVGAKMTGQQILDSISMKLIRRPGFPGVDLQRPVRVYIYKFKKALRPTRGKGGADMVVVLPVSSTALFRRTVAPLLGFGRIRMTIKDGYAVLSSSQWAFQEYRSGRRIKAVVVRNSQLSLYINLKLFHKEISGIMAKMGQRFNRFGSLGKAVLGMYLRFLRDAASIGYNLNLDRSGLEVGFTMGFHHGSALSRVFRSSRSSRLKILDILPADCIATFAGKSPVRQWVKYVSGIVAPLQRANKQLGDLLAELLRYMGKNSTGETAMAMLPQEGMGLSFAAVSGVRSRAASRRFYKQLREMVNKFDFFRRLKAKGVTYRVEYMKNAERISGKDVDIFRLKIEPSRPMASSSGAILKIIRKLFTVRIAYSGGYELMAMGEGSTSRLRTMIRNSNGDGSGFRSSQAYKKFSRKYGRYAHNGMFYFSLQGFFKEILEIAAPLAPRRSRKMLQLIRMPGSLCGYSFSSSKGLEVRMLYDRDAIMGFLNLMRWFMVQKKEVHRRTLDRNRRDYRR